MRSKGFAQADSIESISGASVSEADLVVVRPWNQTRTVPE
jgi:hypothetical protein